MNRRTLLAMAASANACHAQPAYDGLVRPFVDNQEFSGTVLVARGTSVVFQQSYGLANIEWGIPNTNDGKFRIGSMSKQFTAACVLLLAMDGKLDLDAPVSKYLPDSPVSWKPITIHHLLTHTSGIPEVLGFSDFQKALPATLEAMLQRFAAEPLDFPPGAEGRYSNSGYILLARLIELQSGSSFADFLSRKLLRPLGLANTGVDLGSAIISKRVQGYARTKDGLRNADYIDMSVATGAGSLFSTADDLKRWNLKLHSERFLREDLYRRMTTPTFHNYGYGIEIRNEEGDRVIGHGGGMEGFRGYLQFRDADGLTVAVLANRQTNVTGDLANKLAESFRKG